MMAVMCITRITITIQCNTARIPSDIGEFMEFFIPIERLKKPQPASVSADTRLGSFIVDSRLAAGIAMRIKHRG
jgi:hypothetical protein